MPNAHLAKLVDPSILYLLPVLIGYSGGALAFGHRGGVVGAVATMGVVAGSSIPMFLGAMLVGPLGGWLTGICDRLLQPRIPAGFEMLVANFSAGFLGLALMLFGYTVAGTAVSAVTLALGAGAKAFTDAGLLPLAAVVIEPAKVLFVNNAINHGILSPLGVAEAKQAGKSVFFLLESNPGPGVGLLAAYALFGKGPARASSPGAIVVQFFGGIHEMYFPYVLMNPLTILGVMAGGVSAAAIFAATHAGLVATPSPGSIFAEIAMAPKGGLVPVLLGITVSAVVSFLVSALIVRRSGVASLPVPVAEKAAAAPPRAPG
jgi:PTS system mannitol-specific IIC component